MLRLEFPNPSHKNEYISMIEEWKNHETPTSPWALFRGEDFDEFLQITKEDMVSNRYWVPATLFVLVNPENKIFWAIQIRHHIDHPNLIEIGGHIGYGIRPSERWKWYAKEMLKLALIESQKLSLDRVLITCDDENIPSYKVIEANWWIFERYGEREDGGRWRRYWIDLK